MASARNAGLEVAAWALYDLANTIYSLNILSYHFPLWLTVDKGLAEWKYSALLAVSGAVSAFAMPVFGFLSDQIRSRRIPLAILTLGCVASTALLGKISSLPAVAALFVVSTVFYQGAQVVYNAMIARVGARRAVGAVSGLGVAAGYLGTLFALAALKPFYEAGGRQATFVPTAAMFLFFSLPCLAAVGGKETAAAEAVSGFARRLFKYDFGRIRSALTRSPAVFCFSVYSFLMLNVTAIAILFMTVFAKKAAGLSDAEIQVMVGVSSGAGIAGALASGYFYAKAGGARVLGAVQAAWAVVFLLAAGYTFKPLFFAAAAVAGCALGATWSATRVFLMEIVPEEELGEYYGIFGFLGRLANLTGPAFLALFFKIFEGRDALKYGLMNGCLLVLTAFGAYWLLRTVRSSASGQAVP